MDLKIDNFLHFKLITNPFCNFPANKLEIYSSHCSKVEFNVKIRCLNQQYLSKLKKSYLAVAATFRDQIEPEYPYFFMS